MTTDLLKALEGALVAGLFEEKRRELQFPVLRWKFSKGLSQIENNISERKRDLLCFGVAVTHRGQRLCEAKRCPNWSYVWTPRAGDRFAFEFRPTANLGVGLFFVNRPTG